MANDRTEIGGWCWVLEDVGGGRAEACVLCTEEKSCLWYKEEVELLVLYFLFFYFDFVLWLNYIDLMFLFYSSSSTYPFICIHSFGFLLLLLILYVKRISRIDNTSQMGNTSEQRNHPHQ